MKEIKQAILDFLLWKIDRENYGMMSNYRVNNNTLKLLKENKVEVNDREILQDRQIIFTIKHNYASRKIDGMYKQLKPTLIPAI